MLYFSDILTPWTEKDSIHVGYHAAISYQQKNRADLKLISLRPVGSSA